MPTATLTSKGQVTVPKKVREILRIGPGDQVDFVVDDKGRVSVRAVNIDFRELRGLLHRPGMRPVSLEEMDAAIARVHSKLPGARSVPPRRARPNPLRRRSSGTRNGPAR